MRYSMKKVMIKKRGDLLVTNHDPADLSIPYLQDEVGKHIFLRGKGGGYERVRGDLKEPFGMDGPDFAAPAWQE